MRKRKQSDDLIGVDDQLLTLSIRAFVSKMKSREDYVEYKPPFEKNAMIYVDNYDWENARWEGGADLPVPFSGCNLVYIDRLPWELVEVFNEPERDIRWFKRSGKWRKPN